MYPPGYNCCCDTITWVLRPCVCCEEGTPAPHYYVRNGPVITQKSYNRALLTTDDAEYTMYWWDSTASGGAGGTVVITVTVDNPGGAGPDDTVGKVAEKIAAAWNAAVGVTITTDIEATWDNDGYVMWTAKSAPGFVETVSIVFSIGHFAYTAGAWEFPLNPVTDDSSGTRARYPKVTPTAFAAAVLAGKPVIMTFAKPPMSTVASSAFEPRHLLESTDAVAPTETCYEVEPYDPENAEHDLTKLVELDWRKFFVEQLWIEDAESPARYYEGNYPIAEYQVEVATPDCGEDECAEVAVSCPVICGDACWPVGTLVTVAITMTITLDDDSEHVFSHTAENANMFQLAGANVCEANVWCSRSDDTPCIEFPTDDETVAIQGSGCSGTHTVTYLKDYLGPTRYVAVEIDEDDVVTALPGSGVWEGGRTVASVDIVRTVTYTMPGNINYTLVDGECIVELTA